ncbi:MAG: hypothetical protein H8E35_15610 [Ardenticatenia bacterium]|nr:hypothetical protein [Ardenticatenia bacterium]
MLIDERKFLNLEAETSLQAVHEAPGSPELFRRTLTGPLTWQQRNEITVRRALRSPGQAPQWVAALLAWDAIVICEGEEQPLADFLLRRRMQPTLEALRVPLDNLNRTWGESRVARSPADPPIVAVIAVADWADGLVESARLALTGVWHSPAKLAKSAAMLAGGVLDDDQIEGVIAAVQQEVSPPDNFLGSAEYRREMAAVLTRRALQACRNGANNG